MNLSTHLTVRIAACLCVAFGLPGCSSDARERSALSAYQSAAAANDLIGERKALLELVQAKDDVPDYWAELGKLQISMGDFNGAYYAFSRAYELDRSNVDVLRAVTQLSLRVGDVSGARTHADELAVLAPGDPWPKLVKGWVAITESHFDEALPVAEGLLANAPYDPSATVLKARALLGLQRAPEAVDLLEKQIQNQPSDTASLQLLSHIYARNGDWPKVTAITQRLTTLTPTDRDNALLLVEAGFRSGNVAAAHEASLRLLRPDAQPGLIASVLTLWADHWPSSQRIDDARKLAATAVGLPQKLVYADFLSRFGSPQDAVRLSTEGASLPVTAKNAEANAVLADALWRIGKVPDALSRFNAVLAFDPGNATALRGRAELELRANRAPAAVTDGEKLVSVLPNSPADRLLLARSYAAAGNNAWKDRTLWRAFEDIPGDEKIFAALLESRKNNPEATQQLRDEFERQREQKVGRGIF